MPRTQRSRAASCGVVRCRAGAVANSVLVMRGGLTRASIFSSRIKPDGPRVDGVRLGGDVIRVCVASGISSSKDDLGIKNFTITYDCAGGLSFKRDYIGNYRGIVRDPNR
ncbi:MAG: hypothetical protein QOF63_3917 [Thermoanaerobaculia bacterium]|nr:hypothetical protein [Thermoanaerobaculia bacterium]